MSSIDTKKSSVALVAGHMVGMIDLAALPVWVGTLISGFGFQPAEAGGLATVFLAGVVISSVMLSPFFHRMSGRWMPTLGFTVGALMFFIMTVATGFIPFLILHLIAGLFTGLAISFVHGTMARTKNPHRIFGLGGLGLGILAIVFLASAPPIIASSGPEFLFYILGGFMAIGAVVTALMFPTKSHNENLLSGKTSFSPQVWLVIVGVMCMALVHAMNSSFLERIGADRGFSLDQVQVALMIMGIVALTPAILATLLQSKLQPITVAITGVILQAMAVAVLTRSTGYNVYVASIVVLPFVMIFTHTFLFGYMARIEPTGRANAATPAMVMAGSATGPLIGGGLVQFSGYDALSVAAILIGALALFAFARSKGVRSIELVTN